MKGPGVRSDQDVRRLWRCPLCDKVTRTGGQITSVVCNCNGQRTWMRLEKTPQRPRYVPPPRELEPVEDYTLPPDPPRAEKAISVVSSDLGETSDEQGNRDDSDNWRDLLAAESGLTIDPEFQTGSTEGSEPVSEELDSAPSRPTDSSRRNQRSSRGPRPASGERRDRGSRGDRGPSTSPGSDSRAGQGPRGPRNRSGGGPARPGQKPNRSDAPARSPQGGTRPTADRPPIAGESATPGEAGESVRGNRRRRNRQRPGQLPLPEGTAGAAEPVTDNIAHGVRPTAPSPEPTEETAGESTELSPGTQEDGSTEGGGSTTGGRNRKPRRRRRGGRGPKEGGENLGNSGASESSGDAGGESFGAGLE